MSKNTISGSFVVGNATTNPIQLNDRILTGITIAGSAITGTSLTFLVSSNGTDYYPLYDSSSTEVMLTVSASARSYPVNIAPFMPWGWVKARLGTSASSVAQTTYNQAVLFHTETW